jgi:predicted RND superfamily exporter protein
LGKVDASIQAEIENAVDTDMIPIYMVIMVHFVLMLALTVLSDRKRWVIAVADTSVLGFAVFAQLGIYGWLVKVGDAP